MSGYLEKSKQYKGYHYSVLSKDMLDYLHSKTLMMLKEIIPVFENNDIEYMICGGTLLGAVSTGHFIPWDDDIDICIMERDFERALKLLKNSIPNWMIVQWYDTEPNYYHGWAKVRDKGSHVYPDTPLYQENGVWIDLYRLKETSDKEVSYIIAKEHFDYLERRFRVGDITDEERQRRLAEGHILERLEKCENCEESENESKQIYVIWSASKIVVDVDNCFPRKKYIFEGLQLYGFKNADQYLSSHYGKEYKTLPPEEMRRVGINYIDIYK